MTEHQSNAISALETKLRDLGVSEPDIEEACRGHAAGDPSALLRTIFLRLMWSEVANETENAEGKPQWVEDWQRRAESGFPFIDARALERLVASGADLVAVRDVVRSAQVLLIYNLANILGDGWRYIQLLLGEELAQGLHWELLAANVRDGSTGKVVSGLHDCLGDHDPSGRGAEPRAADS